MLTSRDNVNSKSIPAIVDAGSGGGMLIRIASLDRKIGVMVHMDPCVLVLG